MLERYIGFIAVLAILSCSAPADEQKDTRPLVYEGMPASELRMVLGEPVEIDKKGEIYNGQTMKKMPLEHWVYEKRTVVLINDTVKNPNFN